MTPAVRVRVYHSYYGCETGCCGHTVELKMPDGTRLENFEFKHPNGQDVGDWAREFVKEVVQSEWPACLDSIDWGSIVVEADDSC